MDWDWVVAFAPPTPAWISQLPWSIRVESYVNWASTNSSIDRLPGKKISKQLSKKMEDITRNPRLFSHPISSSQSLTYQVSLLGPQHPHPSIQPPPPSAHRNPHHDLVFGNSRRSSSHRTEPESRQSQEQLLLLEHPFPLPTPQDALHCDGQSNTAALTGVPTSIPGCERLCPFSRERRFLVPLSPNAPPRAEMRK